MADQDNELEKIGKRLRAIELRLSKLESGLNIAGYENLYRSEEQVQRVGQLSNQDPAIADEEETGLESQIGRFGLAWLGNIVLLFGITFLTQYLMNLGFRFLSVFIGYIAAAGIFFIAEYLKKSNVHLAFMFRMNACILLYYTTIRLHFFSASPLISNKAISVFLLLLLVVYQACLSVRNKSQAYAALSVFFAIATGIIGDATHFTLPITTLTAAATVYYFYRFNWKPLLIGTIFLTYISFFLWLFGNPFMGHPMQMLAEHHFGIIYLFGLGAFFSVVLLFRKRDASYDSFLIGVTFTNGILFTFSLLLVVLRFFSTEYVLLFSLITICCLTFSTILHSESDWNFASAFYALYGFMALSIALYGLIGFPKVYLLLAVQSLLVVSMALWFRNKLIAILNSLLFMTILAVYLVTSKSVNEVNFSFALISLVTARIINWQRSRLHIETDLIRNLYLVQGFIMVMYALFHAVPKQFITLSWTMAALLYFLLSFILKNVKYRYMALGTMICAAFYLFLVDLAKIDLIYRVLALLFLAAISISISIYYTNRIKKTET
jgi:hypothetical protein